MRIRFPYGNCEGDGRGVGAVSENGDAVMTSYYEWGVSWLNGNGVGIDPRIDSQVDGDGCWSGWRSGNGWGDG